MLKKLSCLTLTVFSVLSIPMTVSAKKLNKRDGVNYFGHQKETYYNLDMSRIYERADRNFGSHHRKWTREDGVKMYGPYVVLAVNYRKYPYGTTDIPTSLGLGVALDTGAFATEENLDQVDIAVNW